MSTIATDFSKVAYGAVSGNYDEESAQKLGTSIMEEGRKQYVALKK